MNRDDVRLQLHRLELTLLAKLVSCDHPDDVVEKRWWAGVHLDDRCALCGAVKNRRIDDQPWEPPRLIESASEQLDEVLEQLVDEVAGDEVLEL